MCVCQISRKRKRKKNLMVLAKRWRTMENHSDCLWPRLFSPHISIHNSKFSLLLVFNHYMMDVFLRASEHGPWFIFNIAADTAVTQWFRRGSIRAAHALAVTKSDVQTAAGNVKCFFYELGSTETFLYYGNNMINRSIDTLSCEWGKCREHVLFCSKTRN